MFATKTGSLLAEFCPNQNIVAWMTADADHARSADLRDWPALAPAAAE
jgi:hypothetical protein